MTRNYQLYLKDILSAIESVEKFITKMTLNEFMADDKTASAVVRKYEIIGEATKQIPDEIRTKYPDIPWKEMAGMRDKLIHFYFGIDYKLIWETSRKRLPLLKPLLKDIISNIES